MLIDSVMNRLSASKTRWENRQLPTPFEIAKISHFPFFRATKYLESRIVSGGDIEGDAGLVDSSPPCTFHHTLLFASGLFWRGKAVAREQAFPRQC